MDLNCAKFKFVFETNDASMDFTNSVSVTIDLITNSHQLSITKRYYGYEKLKTV